MLPVVFTVLDGSGNPLPGLAPTWATYLNARTGAAATQPGITALGNGRYKYTPASDEECGMMLMGGGATPQYKFFSATSVATLGAFALTDDTPKAGLTLTWNSLVYENGGAVVPSPPVFTDLGGGMYKVADWPGSRIVGTINLGITAYPSPQDYDSAEIVVADGSVMSLLQLRTAVRQRADIVNNTAFFPDVELNSYINMSIAELYDLLIQKYGNNYFVQESQFSTDGASDVFALPPDFFKGLGVDLIYNDVPNGRITLRPYNFADRNRLVYPNAQVTFGLMSNLRYRFEGSNIKFIPLPSAGQKISIWYIPRVKWLSADTDTCDGISGWLEYVIVDAAIKCLQKEESDCTVLMAQKAALIERIESAAENRDAGFPATVQDTTRRGQDGSWGWGWGDMGGPS